MTRINAGNTLANQYAPPFVITDSIATSWQLRWNADLIAFEAYDPSENVIVTGFDTIESALFTDVTQQVFVVPWEAVDKASVQQVNALIKMTLEQNLPSRLSVTGQITDWKRHSSGHCYFLVFFGCSFSVQL